VSESADKRKLERDVAELRAENEELRSMLRAGDIRSRREQGRRLRRRLVAGEPASMRFQKGYRRLLGDVNDLLDEGQAAHDAGAHHHANWAVKAADVVLARLKLAQVTFEEGGGGGWVEVLAESRPEYEPRGAFSVDAS
jgi:hypothetical protein